LRSGCSALSRLEAATSAMLASLDITGVAVPKFVVEREVPGLGNLSDAQVNISPSGTPLTRVRGQRSDRSKTVTAGLLGRMPGIAKGDHF
jgi:hypothetical protein